LARLWDQSSESESGHDSELESQLLYSNPEDLMFKGVPYERTMVR